jgi:Ran GTPase-activating protein (RanGAP) involved in mRNA processing and transport
MLFSLEFPPYRNELLEKTIDQYGSQSSICLDQMTLIDQDMNIIVKQAIVSKQCQLLSLQNNQISFIGLSILAEVLWDNESLETLYLNGNQICDDAIRYLTEPLSTKNKKLKTVFLQKNRITNRGIKYLAEMLKNNSTLSWIYLGENSIDDEGVRLLTEVLTNDNRTLEMLVLSSNTMVTDTSVSYLISMIKQNQTLKKLWIENCRLSSEGKKALIDIQKTKNDFYVHV